MIKTIEEITQEKTLAEIIVARDKMIIVLHTQMMEFQEKNNMLTKQLEEKNKIIENLLKETKQ